MIQRTELLAEARTWLGSPYKHQGRLHGVGVDCVGIVIGLAKFCGTPFKDVPAYLPDASDININIELGRWLQLLPMDRVRPGDVLTFWVRNERWPQHCGIVSDYGLIHTHASVGRVVEHRMDERWERRRWQAFRFPEVTD